MYENTSLQTVSSIVSCIGLGWVQIFPLVVGWVGSVSWWVGLGHTKWTHGQLWANTTLLKDEESARYNHVLFWTQAVHVLVYTRLAPFEARLLHAGLCS